MVDIWRQLYGLDYGHSCKVCFEFISIILIVRIHTARESTLNFIIANKLKMFKFEQRIHQVIFVILFS